MFKLHSAKKRFILILIVGYFGSVGIATISDIIIPHIGTALLRLHIPSHADIHHSKQNPIESSPHHQDDNTFCGHKHHSEEHRIHFGFIEEWYIVNPAALLGILIAYFLPRTKFPHSAHVLISTWASSSYILMNAQDSVGFVGWISIFVILFLAVWLPCCISDIVFPLLFVKPNTQKNHHWR